VYSFVILNSVVNKRKLIEINLSFRGCHRYSNFNPKRYAMSGTFVIIITVLNVRYVNNSTNQNNMFISIEPTYLNNL
jgi:hypothetical protein